MGRTKERQKNIPKPSFRSEKHRKSTNEHVKRKKGKGYYFPEMEQIGFAQVFSTASPPSDIAPLPQASSESPSFFIYLAPFTCLASYWLTKQATRSKTANCFILCQKKKYREDMPCSQKLTLLLSYY